MEKILFQYKKSLEKFNNFAIVDDLLATGGTVDCVTKIVKNNGKRIIGILTVVELVNLHGRSKFNFPIESILSL